MGAGIVLILNNAIVEELDKYISEPEMVAI